MEIKERKIAIIIGNSDYSESADLVCLPSCVYDTRFVAKYIQQYEFQKYLFENKPVSEIEQTIASIKMKYLREIFIYVSGFAIVDDNNDVNFIDYDRNKLNLSELVRSLKSSNSSLLVILIIDACYTSNQANISEISVDKNTYIVKMLYNNRMKKTDNKTGPSVKTSMLLDSFKG